MYYTVEEQSGSLRTLEKCRTVFSNARLVLLQWNTRLRLPYLLNNLVNWFGLDEWNRFPAYDYKLHTKATYYIIISHFFLLKNEHLCIVLLTAMARWSTKLLRDWLLYESVKSAREDLIVI